MIAKDTTRLKNNADNIATRAAKYRLIHDAIKPKKETQMPQETTGVNHMVHLMRSDTYNVADLIADLQPGGIIIEVGAWVGESSVLFAQHFDHVICVDSWNDKLFIDGHCAADAYNEFLRRIHPYSNISYVRMDSVPAASLFASGIADKLYIDADHKYPSVKADIAAWKHVLKVGGYYCGHDYNTERFPGCVQAIHEMLGTPHKVYNDTSWMIPKGA